MPTVLDLVRRLTPAGTNTPAATDDPTELPSLWQLVPLWPPDSFAVAAALVSRSGCHAHPAYIGHAGQSFFTRAELDRLTATGQVWADKPDPRAGDDAIEQWLVRLLTETPLQDWWEVLLGHGHWEVTHRGTGTAPLPWCDAAMRVMIAADVAAAGFGFLSSNSKSGFGPNLAFDEYVQYLRREAGTGGRRRRVELPYIPRSLCQMVPPTEACVQPKAVTSQVGCTLNNYTHNLSLLPSFREVETRWRYAFEAGEVRPEQSPHPMALNVLVVPFPYTIPAAAFGEGPGFGKPGGRANPAHVLHLDQTWLKHQGAPIGTDRFHDELLAGLLEQAERALPEGQAVHAVVLPELALDKDLATGLAHRLAPRPGIEWFIAGSSFGGPAEARNVAYAGLFLGGRVYEQWWQSKHHRWKVERSQIEGYGLTPPLDPAKDYWEGINVDGRTCVVWAFRPGTTMSILICEDLARREPVQDALRAIGPNLVVALLMDGPQLTGRWPGRYATVLADDPGSSVLTVTSLGLVAAGNAVRQRRTPPERTSRSVILWKEPVQLACEDPLPEGCGVQPGRTDQIDLEEGNHAVLLRLTSREVGTFSMDGRYDGGATVRIHLARCDQIPHPHPPAWI